MLPEPKQQTKSGLLQLSSLVFFYVPLLRRRFLWLRLCWNCFKVRRAAPGLFARNLTFPCDTIVSDQRLLPLSFIVLSGFTGGAEHEKTPSAQPSNQTI